LLSCEGLGLYSYLPLLNHSCNPNAAPLKQPQDQDDRTSVIAIRDINPGEEISISYIDESVSLEDRKEQLLDFGFDCQCEKCIEENAMNE